jgi:hypothetical protein
MWARAALSDYFTFYQHTVLCSQDVVNGTEFKSIFHTVFTGPVYI